MTENVFNQNLTDSEREDLKILSVDENSYQQSVSTLNKLKDLHRLFYLREDWDSCSRISTKMECLELMENEEKDND